MQMSKDARVSLPSRKSSRPCEISSSPGSVVGMTLFQRSHPKRCKRRDQFLCQVNERLRVNANEVNAGDGNRECSLQRWRQREWFVVSNAIAEVHHLDEADVVIERNDCVDDGPA